MSSAPVTAGEPAPGGPAAAPTGEPVEAADRMPARSAGLAARSGPRLAALPSRLAPLFPAHRASRPDRRSVLLGLVALVAGTALSLGRTGGAGALDSTWIEDAAIFLDDALAKRWWQTEFIPLNGYYTVGPRVITEIATRFPLAWAPAVMSVIAAAMTALCGLIAYLASGPYLGRRWLRLLVSVPVVVAPMAWDQISNDTATLQFPMLYALFWVLLWRPGTRTGAAAALLVAGYDAFSAVLSVVFAPLVLARVLVVRDRLGRLLAAVYATGMTVQFVGIALGRTAQTPLRHPRYNPAWALYEYVTTAVPRALFGQRVMNDESLHRPAWQWLLVLVSWLVLAGVVMVATRRAAPDWGLAGLAAVHSLGLFGLAVTQMGSIQPRYVLPPALLLYTALAAMLRPAATAGTAGAAGPAPALGTAGPLTAPAGGTAGRPGRRPAVLAATALITALLTVACVTNYRMPNGRSRTPSWSSAMAGAEAACAAHPGPWTYYWRYSWWFVHIPCSYVRD